MRFTFFISKLHIKLIGLLNRKLAESGKMINGRFFAGDVIDGQAALLLFEKGEVRAIMHSANLMWLYRAGKFEIETI